MSPSPKRSSPKGNPLRPFVAALSRNDCVFRILQLRVVEYLPKLKSRLAQWPERR